MTNDRPRVLFIADKWCAGKKEFGLSEWENGIQDSLRSIELAEVDVFHLDDHFIRTGQKGDAEIVQKIQKKRPDLICLIMYKMPGTAYNALEWSTLAEIKNVFNIPMIAIWGDLEIKEQVEISLAISPFVEINAATACSSVISRIDRPDKYIYTWVPRDPKVFHNPNKPREIDLSYVGTPKKDRLSKVKFLTSHGIEVQYGGGERQEHLTTEQYADRYQRSKITLSFSRASASHVVNARPFEAMACGAMLLEQESFELMKLYTPYVDYVPYSGKKDLLKKARYYLSHNEEREKIARNGQRKTEELYSAKRFWQIVIGLALKNDSAEKYQFNYSIPPESLARLSGYVAVKMKFLNSLCSNQAGFLVYKTFNRLFWQDQILIGLSKLNPLFKKILPEKAFKTVLKLKRKIY